MESRAKLLGHPVHPMLIVLAREKLPTVVGRLFAPDLFSGWGIRTLSTRHAFYNPLSYHRGTVWAVEQATIMFGLRRFGFGTMSGANRAKPGDGPRLPTRAARWLLRLDSNQQPSG